MRIKRQRNPFGWWGSQPWARRRWDLVESEDLNRRKWVRFWPQLLRLFYCSSRYKSCGPRKRTIAFSSPFRRHDGRLRTLKTHCQCRTYPSNHHRHCLQSHNPSSAPRALCLAAALLSLQGRSAFAWCLYQTSTHQSPTLNRPEGGHVCGECSRVGSPGPDEAMFSSEQRSTVLHFGSSLFAAGFFS